jgi:hypothetical protein
VPVDTDVEPVEDTTAPAATRDDVLQDPLGAGKGKKPKDPPSLRKLMRQTEKLLKGRQKFFEKIVPLNEGGDWPVGTGETRRMMLQTRLAQLLGRDWVELQMCLDRYNAAKTDTERRKWLGRMASQVEHIQQQLGNIRVMGACTPEASEMLEELEAELLKLWVDMRTRSFDLIDEADVEAVDQVKNAMRDALVL